MSVENEQTKRSFESALDLTRVMFSSYIWGFSADTLGRRASLLLAMPVGMLLNLAASLAPTYIALACLKLFSACFTSSANAAGFVLLAESAPDKYRSKFVFLMASATLLVQFVLCLVALPVLDMSFKAYISWLSLTFSPWRLLMVITCAPGIIGILALIFLKESPKFLLSKGHDENAMNVLKTIYKCNTGSPKESFPVSSVFLEDNTKPSDKNLLIKIWDQTAPLFKRPLLRNNLLVYFMLLCSFMISTGFTMWVPTMTNAYFTNEDSSGKTFCEVASTAASSRNGTPIEDCDTAVKHLTLYAVIFYSGFSGILNVLLTFVVDPLGKKRTTILIFAIAAVCGVILLFVRIPLLSIALFFGFLYISLNLGNANTYLIENNPTHLRGMATCLSVVVARGFGFLSVQVIGTLLADNCTPMLIGYVSLLVCGLGAAFLLPSDNNLKNSNK
ncbi:synaptic vesicle glycoprotein 2B-like isoform X2 [Aricia agestis]|uniref:synaptic vesicle glycoprotein 2B-like isoform X2 n=1 Tax=Aricia agestis TaxID=91739 RepID=UPI001C203AE1|nr:synaptic vesicle glycoprotein 2B-like isoform X2 [Aricia agestis]